MPNVGKIDFKTGEYVPAENGQPAEVKTEEVKEEVETEEVETETKTEDVETLPQWAKDRILKVEEEKENYKKGMLKYKKKTLEPEKEEEKEEEEYPEWDETSKKFQEQTEKKAAIIAESKAKQMIEKATETNAIEKFLSKHPELEDNEKWGEVISNYTPKHGKETATSIVKDLDRALFLTRYERGEITGLEKESFEKGKKKGEAEGFVADKSSVSKTTSKSVKEKGSSLSERAKFIAKQLGNDPEKVAEKEDSLTATTNF